MAPAAIAPWRFKGFDSGLSGLGNQGKVKYYSLPSNDLIGEPDPSMWRTEASRGEKNLLAINESRPSRDIVNAVEYYIY